MEFEFDKIIDMKPLILEDGSISEDGVVQKNREIKIVGDEDNSLTVSEGDKVIITENTTVVTIVINNEEINQIVTVKYEDE